MQIKLSFLGAAQNVTGSRFLVESNGTRVLVDCGLYQERKLVDRNWDRFPVPADSIDAVLLTHAHLDHCGMLPKLVKEGFKGKIFCTAATAEIAQIIVMDSAHIQEEDAKYKRKRHAREGRKSPRPVAPLYTVEDARKCANMFEYVEYGTEVQVADGMAATYCDAGHVLGSASINLKVVDGGQERSILFSGDVGRDNKPIIEDPDRPTCADYILIESTYGDRIHKSTDQIAQRLEEVINETSKAGGNIIIPSFALERSQEVLYHLNELVIAKRIPNLMVFLDSPMAIRITDVFKKHPEIFDEEMTRRLQKQQSPFDFPGLKMAQTTNESKAINHIHGTVVVIAGSGMCTGGRVKHHLINNITKPETTILFVGYQAFGTLGRHIAQGDEEIRIFGRMLQVKAKIVTVDGFSAHADRDELMHWLSEIKRAPRKVFVIHGETGSSRHFCEHLKEKKGWDVSVPSYRDEVILD